MIARAELLPHQHEPRQRGCSRATGRDSISWSALSTFQTCPLKYKFRYIGGLPEESVSAALIFGSGIRRAVEQHSQARLAGDPKPDLDALLFAYRGCMAAARPGGDSVRLTLPPSAIPVLMLGIPPAGILDSYCISGKTMVSRSHFPKSDPVSGKATKAAASPLARA